MRLVVSRCWLVVAMLLGGCGPELSTDARLVDMVQVSKSEPGPWCRPLGAVEGAADRDIGAYDRGGYPAAYHALRVQTAAAGGNYVVIDHVASGRPAVDAWRDTVIGGRAYSCPVANGVAKVRVYVPDPPEQVSDDGNTVVRPPAPVATR